MDAEVAKIASEVREQLATPAGVKDALEQATRYLTWFAAGEQLLRKDEAMLARISELLESGQDLHGADENFLIHELVEERMLREYQREPHAALRRFHGDFGNYACEVVRQFPDEFNSNWKSHCEGQCE